MRPRGRVLVITLALGLSACHATTEPREAPLPCPVIARANLTVQPLVGRPRAVWGITLVGLGSSGYRHMTLNATMVGNPNLALNVARHELGHVLGLPCHQGTVAGWMRAPIAKAEGTTATPTVSEVAMAQARSHGRRWRLEPAADLPDGLRVALWRAASEWNGVLGREAFTR